MHFKVNKYWPLG